MSSLNPAKLRCRICNWLFMLRPPTDRLCDECRIAVRSVTVYEDDMVETANLYGLPLPRFLEVCLEQIQK